MSSQRGEQKQAVGRSRRGRNTKIHALADVKGRLIAILLTTGEAHDCPVAEPSKRILGRLFPVAAIWNDRDGSALAEAERIATRYDRLARTRRLRVRAALVLGDSLAKHDGERLHAYAFVLDEINEAVKRMRTKH